MSYEPSGFSRKYSFCDEKSHESSNRFYTNQSNGEKPAVNGVSCTSQRVDDVNQRKNYKLLIDPAIKKGHQKIYRFDGVFPGQPPVIPKDPRSRRTRLWTLNKADLPVPSFKFDKWYVGIPPQKEVVVTGLNDNVDQRFLAQMCEKFGKTESIKIYYDPVTKKHLGRGKITFTAISSAKLAVSKLNSMSVMGNIIHAQLEPNIKGLEARSKQQKSHDLAEKKPLRRCSTSEVSDHSTGVKTPGLQPLNLHLPTPSPSVGSHSPSSESCHSLSSSYPLDPRLKNMSNLTGSLNLGTDHSPRSHRSLTSSSIFMSPRSTTSNVSSFEPISPPPIPFSRKQPPPPPPATTPPPPPVEANEPPPPPPETKILATEPSYGKFEDISPVFSPREEEQIDRGNEPKQPTVKDPRLQRKGSADEAKISKLIESFRKESSKKSPSRHSPLSERSRSPRSEKSDRSDEYKKYEKRHHDYRMDRKDKDRYYDKDRHEKDRHDDRDRSYKDVRRHDHYSDHRKGDKHREYRNDSRSSYDRRDSYRSYDRKSDRRDDRDRNRNNDSRSNHPYHDESKSWRDREKYSPRRTDERRKSDSRSDSYHKENRHRDHEDHCREMKIASETVQRSEVTKENDTTLEVKQKETKVAVSTESEQIDWTNFSQDLLVNSCENLVTSTVGLASNVSESSSTVSISQVVNVSEIISTVVSSVSADKELGHYDEDAYTFGIENCSDEEPLPPGDERDVAQEVTLDRTRSKIKAAQDAVKKRKLSETTEDRQETNGKSKKIQIVLKGVQLKTHENRPPSPPTPEHSSSEMSEPERGQWRSYSPLSSAVSASENEHNSLKLDVKEEVATTDIESVALGPVKDLPQVEDISPCDSPLVEIATVQTETTDESNTKSEPKVGNNLYSDIEVNDDDDAMSLSSISSNEESFEVNEPVKKLSPRHKPITVPPPNMVFPHFLPPISVPPPGYFPTNVPPPPLAVPVLPPPLPPPVVLPAVNVTVPPPSLPTSVPPPPLPPAHVPPPSLTPASGFYDNRTVPPYSGAFQKYPGHPSHMSGGFLPSDYQTSQTPPRKTWKGTVIDEVFGTIARELETVLKRDVCRKLVEASAFRSLDAWWDNQTKPKATSLTPTTSSAKSSSLHQTVAMATVGQPSSTGTSVLGTSPFERTHSMALGLRASLPKLPSFRFKKRPEPVPTASASPGLGSKRNKTVSPISADRDFKRRRLEDTEADSELDTDLESSCGRSWNKRHRTVSRMEDDERSISPWQHLDESMDAPPATSVRSTEVSSRRPSTGSSLYHKVYSSSSSSESESDDEEEEDEEEEEEEEEQSEMEESEEEEEEESEEESEEDESEEESEEESGDELEVDKISEAKEETTLPSVTAKEKISVDDVDGDDASTTSEISVGTFSPWKPREPERLRDQQNHIERTVFTETLSETSSFVQDKKVAWLDMAESKNIAMPVVELDAKVSVDDSFDEIIDVENTVTSHKPRNLFDEFSKNVTQVNISTSERLEKESEKMIQVVEKDEYTTAAKPLFSEKELGSLDSAVKVETEKDKDETVPEGDELICSDSQTPATVVALDHSYGMIKSESPTIDIVSVPQGEERLPPLLEGNEVLEEAAELVELLPSLVPQSPPAPPKQLFQHRTFEEDDELVYELLKSGLDYEDAFYLKVGFERLLQVGSESVSKAHWTYHPVVASAPPTVRRGRRQKSDVMGLPVHITGSARSEGYYKIDMKDKAKYVEYMKRQLHSQSQTSASKDDKKLDGKTAKQQSRENRATQRRLQSAVCCEDLGDILKFNKLRVRKKQLKFGRSVIHDWGLFALEPIAADEMVIEYVGDVVRQAVADERERRYEESGIGSSYMFRVDQDTIIDATHNGNLARFINHCCDPNCYAKIISVENEKKIVIYSKRDIDVNEEITYDYKFPIEDEKIPCLCGAPGCRGTLN